MYSFGTTVNPLAKDIFPCFMVPKIQKIQTTYATSVQLKALENLNLLLALGFLILEYWNVPGSVWDLGYQKFLDSQPKTFTRTSCPLPSLKVNPCKLFEPASLRILVDDNLETGFF